MGEKLTVIDGKQYREVSRKANVGELVKIVNAVKEARTEYGYDNGEVHEVKRASPRRDGEVDIWPDGTDNSEIYLNTEEYVVLEPVVAEEKSVNPTDIRELYSLVDGLTETVASLTLRVTELECKASAKTSVGDMTVKINVDATDITDLAQKLRKVKTRDEIVEQAKKDVAELEVTDIPYEVPTLSGGKQSYYADKSAMLGACDTVQYVINREKRTVVALIREIDGEVWARGKARCAPDDCFNAHIGRAIALRRALGLAVPTEYFEAPQPTDIRVGDIVKVINTRATNIGIHCVKENGVGYVVEIDSTYKHPYQVSDVPAGNGGVWSSRESFVVIDDSREDTPKAEVSA